MRRDVTLLPAALRRGSARSADVVVVDELAAQLEQLARGRARGRGPAPDAVERCSADATRPRSARGCYYPWRRRLVHVLPERLHRELRLDRNRYAITDAEQERLTGAARRRRRPVGRPRGRVDDGARGHRRRAAAGRLRRRSTSRTSTGSPAALADVGVSKVVLAAREVAELDPTSASSPSRDGVDEDDDRRRSSAARTCSSTSATGWR